LASNLQGSLPQRGRAPKAQYRKKEEYKMLKLKTFSRSLMAVGLVAFLAYVFIPAIAPMEAFAQTPGGAVSAKKERVTAHDPYTYKVTLTVRATVKDICDLEVQVVENGGSLQGDLLRDADGTLTLPTGWQPVIAGGVVETDQSDAIVNNSIAFAATNAADGDPVVINEDNCIKRGKAKDFGLQITGTPPFDLDICFSDKDGKLIGSCVRLRVASFASLPEPSADVMVKQLRDRLEFEARPELASFIQSMNVAIFDIGGRLVTSQETSGPTTSVGLAANGQRLAKGVYFGVVTIRGINGEVLRKVQKFVVRG
jgi:hypothetical protein